MTALRVVLLVLLTVTLDLATPVVPTASGLQWDDDEEVVHLRRSRAPVRVAAEEPGVPPRLERVRARRALAPRVVRTVVVWRPLVRPSDPARLDSAASPEPH
jgi:hypothetical protein